MFGKELVTIHGSILERGGHGSRGKLRVFKNDGWIA
jgi:hypothetical protein